MTPVDGKRICFFILFFLVSFLAMTDPLLKNLMILCVGQTTVLCGQKGLDGNIVFAMLGLWYSYLGLSFFLHLEGEF